MASEQATFVTQHTSQSKGKAPAFIGKLSATLISEEENEPADPLHPPLPPGPRTRSLTKQQVENNNNLLRQLQASEERLQLSEEQAQRLQEE